MAKLCLFLRFFVSCWLIICGGLGFPIAASARVQLSNESLVVTLAEKGTSLVELKEVSSGYNLLDGNRAHPLWDVNVKGKSGVLHIQPSWAKSFRSETITEDVPALRLTWSDLGVEGAPDLTIVATVRLEKNRPMSHWRLALENTGDLVIGKIRYPVIGAVRERDNEQLAVPVWLGQETSEARKVLRGADGKGARREWHYPGELSLQCLSFSGSNAPGLYLSCNDTAAFRKSFAFWGDGEGIHGEVIHLPESTAGQAKRYATEYDTIVGLFRGDWITAAEIYREWGTRQVWAAESRLLNKRMPGWVADTGIWVWNRGRSPGVLKPAMSLQKELGLPVSVFWHWWHGCPYDIGFPEYLPPREGAEPFKKAVATAKRKDVNAIVYMNQRLWGMTTDSWREEGAEQFAVKGEDGKVRPEVYNVFTKQACASMCMHTPFWRNKYAGIAEEVIEDLKVSGIYMDQACSSLACYDPSHGHPQGGGVYWMNGFRKLSTDIRHRVDNKVVLAGEGCGEAWLPYLDLMLALQVARERYAAPKDGWQVIPFFSAVYHPYAVLYGNYSSLTEPPYDDLWPAEFAPKEPLKLLSQKFSNQFFLEQARSFVWGQQPTIANFLPEHLEERKVETEYFMRLAKIRNRALPYLLHGTFLRSPELRVPVDTIPMSRLSIYAGQKGGVTLAEGTFPVVVSGAWQSSKGGVAIALASITEKPVTFPVRLTTSSHPIGRAGKIYRIDAEKRRKIGEWKDGVAEVAMEFESLDACLVEFVSR